MNQLKVGVLVVLLLLATPPFDVRSNGWGRILPLETPRHDVEFPLKNRIELSRYQSEIRLPANAWRGLLPLKATRADVERLLGPPKGSVAGSYSYETKKEKVRVLYSERPCKPSLEGQWKVPNDTVLSITVFPQTTVLVSSLHLDKEIYKRSQEVHSANWAWYVSAETGVMVHAIQSNGCEEVMSITYRPTTKDEDLRCPNNGKTASKKP